MFENLTILNPKRASQSRNGRAGWYPYYAGFSQNFAHSLLSSANLKPNACIMDPWNGSGTTTSAAANLGFHAYGYDLNPVMVVISKARLLSKGNISSIQPITSDILKKARKNTHITSVLTDPLCTWFTPSSARNIRRLEKAIQVLLIDVKDYQWLTHRQAIHDLSELAAFYYTALFRTVRIFLKPFFASNPTWIKKPNSKSIRLRPSLQQIITGSG